MKFDKYGLLVREKLREPGHEIANLGDSCADTCRYAILTGELKTVPFQSFAVAHRGLRGFVRHPLLLDLPGREDWGVKGFTNDQLVPLLMCEALHGSWFGALLRISPPLFIPGTTKIIQPAVYTILFRQWWLLDLMNHIQGWLIALPFRWSDDKSEGTGFRSSKGKVQDYLTMICTTIFLCRLGRKAKLPRPVDECLEAVRLYRQGAKDYEPNAEWEIKVYEDALKAFGFKA